MVHISQLVSTTAVITTNLRDGELGQLLETLATEAKIISQIKQKQLDNSKNEQVEFLSKCRKLVQIVIPGPIEADTDKPLEKAYQLFKSMVSTLQSHLLNMKEYQK